MANIIPMAGIGSRFSAEGYLLPKPLVPVSGKPMILKVIESLPKSEKNIFIVRKEFIDNYKIDNLIKSKIHGAIIVPVGKTTQGQAATCMLAMPYLKKDEPMFITSCDSSFLYDKKKYSKLANDSEVDAVVWTFTKNNLLKESPKSWGWAVLEKDGISIKSMSVKSPVSGNPFDDHAVVATFCFKRARDFEEAYNLMVKENFRINNEFYVDSMPIFYKKLGKRSVIFDVGLYVGWGRPSDLHAYQKWEYLSKNNIKPKNNEKEYLLWKKFFDAQND